MVNIPAQSGCPLDMGVEQDFWIASGGAITITFVTTSDDGIEVNVYLQSAPTVAITEHTFSGAETEAFTYEFVVDPMIVTGGGALTASLEITA